MAPTTSDGLVLKIRGVKIKLLPRLPPHIIALLVGTTPLLDNW